MDNPNILSLERYKRYIKRFLCTVLRLDLEKLIADEQQLFSVSSRKQAKTAMDSTKKSFAALNISLNFFFGLD